MNHRPRRVLTVCGHVKIHRAYYRCAACGRGCCPADEQLGLNGGYSPGVQPLIALAGIVEPFRVAEQLLQQLAGLPLGHEVCRQITETAGERLAQQAGLPETPAATAWDFSLPAADGHVWTQTVAYVGLDAFAVPVLRPDKKREFKMLYVGLLYDPRKEHTVYLADYDHETLAEQLRAAAKRFHFGQVDQVVALTDGGQGLERVLKQHFGGNVQTVLDFWHAAQHLHEFANLWHGVGTGAAQDWSHAAKGVLRSQGGAALWSWLQTHGPEVTATTEVQTKWQELLGYVRNQQHRMDYPSYEAKGWDIGSGPTEAGCKIVGERLKRSGMKWQRDNVEAVAKLRALYLSGEGLWEAFWSSPKSPAA